MRLSQSSAKNTVFGAVIALVLVFLFQSPAYSFYQDATKLDATYDQPLVVGVQTTYTIRAFCPGVSDADKQNTKVQWAFYYNAAGNFPSGLTTSPSISGDVLEWSATFTPTSTIGVNFQVFGYNGNPSSNCLKDSYLFKSVYMTPVEGVVASLGTSTSSPSTIDIALACVSTCSGATNFSFVAVATAAGQSFTVSGTATSNPFTVSFSSLQANTSYLISASTNYSGVSSATVSRTVSTQLPIASGSIASIRDTGLTATLGCSNCGSTPSSFTFSAVPVLGGSTISSNTSTLLGLSPDTGYRLFLSVSYAGTTSNLVEVAGSPFTTSAALAAPSENSTRPSIKILKIEDISPRLISSAPIEITIQGNRLEKVSYVKVAGELVTVLENTEKLLKFRIDVMGSGPSDLEIYGPYGLYTYIGAFNFAVSVQSESGSPTVHLNITSSKFHGNSRALNDQQKVSLLGKIASLEGVETIICWGYTSDPLPNYWAIEHAFARATSTCNWLASEVPSRMVVRIRSGVGHDLAMRTSIQAWSR